MHSTIVAVEMPDDPTRTQWASFLAGIIKTNGNKAVIRLGENVWQINFQASPISLALIVKAAEDLGLPYRILPFDAEPQWLLVGQNPKPK
jgi:hypothetical protein